jgi:hypothetical protein
MEAPASASICSNALPAARVCSPAMSSGAVMHLSTPAKTARQIAVDEHHHIVLGHDLLDRLHEGRVVHPRRMVMVLHQPRHQGEVVFGPLAARIGERENGHVELAARERRYCSRALNSDCDG